MASTLTIQYRNDAVSSTAILVVAGNYILENWNLMGGYATATYLKLYNAATAGAVIVGTTTPVTTLFIPPNGVAFLSNEGQSQWQFPLGIVIAVVTGLQDSSTGAPSTASYVELGYAQNTN